VTSKKSVSAVAAGKSLEEFRTKYDKNFIIPKRIKEALDRLGESWLYENDTKENSDFIRFSGLTQRDISMFWHQFEEYVVTVKVGRSGNPRRAWAGTPKFAQQLREMAG